MKGKVTCTCGWSWNKSDSSAKDMYICHECGRDNSNNMKNGGDIPKAQGGENLITDERKEAVTKVDKTKVKMPNASRIIKDIIENKKEEERQIKDEEEWHSTGVIKNPRSIKYKKAKEELEKRQTYLTQTPYRTEAMRQWAQETGQAIEDKRQFKEKIKPVIKVADVATDIMQLGNFVPHPIGQAIGKIGNVAGSALDAYQAYDDFSEGNYLGGAINAGSIFLPMALGSQTFRRNSKHLQPGQPLYSFSPQANLPANASFSMRLNAPQVNYIEPFTKVRGMTDASLFANRALLGTLGAETMYDTFGGSSESSDTPIFQYQNTDPKEREKEPVSNPKQFTWKGLEPKSKFLPKSIKFPEGEDIYAFEGKKGVLAKNGGWLENYNDSKASAPEGMVGDGFSNVGRNYSPAWGGQFEDGGEIPMAQTGKATRADSLDVYNRALKIDAYYNNLKKKGWYPRRDIYPTTGLTSKELEREMKKIDKESRETYKKQSKDKKGQSILNYTYPNADPKAANLKALADHIALTKGTRYASQDNLPSIIDPMAPQTVVDTRIIPKERVHYETIEGIKDDEFFKKYPNATDAQLQKHFKEMDKLHKSSPPSGSAVNLYRYDPLSVKPWDMLTDAEKKLRVEKYGTDGVPKSYLNKIKPPDKDKDKSDEITPIQRPKLEALQSLQPQGVVSNLFSDAKLPVIRPEAKVPKYWDVDFQAYNIPGGRMTFHDRHEGTEQMSLEELTKWLRLQELMNQGYDERYRWDNLRERFPNAPQKWIDKQTEKLKAERAALDVKLTATPHYQTGGQFENGGLIPIAQKGDRVPATRSDSLAVYNSTRAVEDYFKKQGYIKEIVKDTKRHKDSEKHAKSWVNEAQKMLNAAKKQPLIPGLVTKASKNKQIAEAKGYLNSAQKSLSKTKDEVNPKNYLKKLEDSRVLFNEKGKDVGTYVDEQGNLIEGKPSAEKFYSPIDENRFYQREQSQGFLDLRSPMPLYDERITPQDLSVYISPESIKQDELVQRLMKTENQKEKDEIEKQLKDLKYSDHVEMYDYDPLAVMPFDILKEHPELIPERIKKYGIEGIPTSVIQQHPEWGVKIPIKNTTQPQPIKDPVTDTTQTISLTDEQVANENGMYDESVTPREPNRYKYVSTEGGDTQTGYITNPEDLEYYRRLQKMYNEGDYRNWMGIKNKVEITPEYDLPGSWDVNLVRYNMQGPSDHYNYNLKGVDYRKAMDLKAITDAYNAKIQKKYGPQNEYRTPKSAEEAAKRLKQLRQEFSMTPSYQMGGNVYPVNYVPQAQNGTKKKKKGAQDLLRDVENSINKSLGNPMQKAHTAAEQLAGKWYNPKTKQWEENDPVDNFRHPMAGRYTSEAIQDKLYNIPILSQIVGFTGSNALGVAHELSTLSNPKDKRGWYDKIRESGEDIFNNTVGATVGSLPISGKAKTNILTRLSNENMIPDGVSGKGGDMYRKHAMGGSIPGSVGFTYARTQGIPSEGPYAKKTMASAQEGTQIKENNDWLANWYANRKIANEQLQSLYEEDKPYYLERLKNIPEVTNVDLIGDDPNITGSYKTDTNQILVTPQARDNVYLHEANHYLNNFPSAMRTVHGNITSANIAPKENLTGVYKDKYDYFSNPDEVHSRIQVLRKKANLQPDEEVTPEKLNKFLKTYKGDDENINDLLNLSDTDHLLEMLNYMAYNEPSNTSSIAQNGKEMSYYQNGLDWKPKGMKNGGWLDQYDVAANGTTTQETTKPDKFAMIKQIIQNQKKGKSPFDLKNHPQYGKDLKNTKANAITKKQTLNYVKKLNAEAEKQRIADERAIVTDREARMADAMKAQDEDIIGNPNWKEVLARETQSTGDKFRLFPNDPHSFFDDWLNPGVMIGDMASGLGAAPYEMERQESIMPLVTGIGAPLLAGALGGIGAKTNKQFINNMFNPVTIVPRSSSAEKYFGNKLKTAIPVSIKGNLKKGIEKIQKSDTYKAIDEHLSGLEEGLFYDKRPFFEKFPITKAQKEKVYAAQDEAFEEGQQFIKDWYYGDDIDLHPDIVDKMKELDPNFKLSVFDNTNITNTSGTYANPFAKTNNVLVSTRRNALNNENISDYAKEYMLKNRNKFRGVSLITDENLTLRNAGLYHLPPEQVKFTGMHELGHTGEGLGTMAHWDPNGNFVSESIPFDRIRTYDPDFTDYNMANPNTDQGKLFQEAMVEPTPHIFDANGNITKRGYTWAASPGELGAELLPARSNLIDAYVAQGHDRKEIMNMLRAGASDAQIDWMIDNKNLNRFFKPTTSPELKRKVIRMLYAGVPAAVGLDAITSPTSEEVPSGMKQGGVIKDDRGQWEHPGEITEINSPYITMQGVPYDVLGISDTGDTKLMKPGKDYKFKGKKVTEFPMAKNGMRQEQKGLVNLDNLLNFTNYNKPQPGGWLNKYN